VNKKGGGRLPRRSSALAWHRTHDDGGEAANSAAHMLFNSIHLGGGEAGWRRGRTIDGFPRLPLVASKEIHFRLGLKVEKERVGARGAQNLAFKSRIGIEVGPALERLGWRQGGHPGYWIITRSPVPMRMPDPTFSIMSPPGPAGRLVCY